MKRIIFSLLVSILWVAGAEAQKYIKVRLYGGTNPYAITEWNNWDVNTATSPAYIYSDGSISTVTGVLTGAFAIGDNGATYGSASTNPMAPLEVLRYVSDLSVNRSLTLHGLSADKTYNLELYASRYNNSGNSTQFVINGVSQAVATYQNFTNKASFTSLAANASGQIVVSIEKLNTYLYINGFTLTEISTPPPPPATGDGWSLSGNDATAAQFIGTKNNVPLLFKTNNVSQMRITTGGEVQVKKLKVTQTGWADYVFEPHYKLRPLSEVEKFINKHGHLPEVPSAKEVTTEGLNVGDNQAVLLKKIEELTLYMIEQNKKLEVQGKEIKVLQRQAKSKKK